MIIDSTPNNCVLIAIRTIRPDIAEGMILYMARKCGFRGHGMFDHEWKNLLIELGIKFEKMDLKKYHPRHSSATLKRNMTLGRVAKLTKDHICLVKIRGHVVVTYYGEIIDPSRTFEGSRRRVFDTYRIIDH